MGVFVPLGEPEGLSTPLVQVEPPMALKAASPDSPALGQAPVRRRSPPRAACSFSGP
jgi:hypothetical protein